MSDKLTDAELAGIQGRYNRNSDHEAVGDRAKLLGHIAALTKERDALLPYARMGAWVTTDLYDNEDIDRGDVFDAAIEFGVVVKVDGGFDPEKHSTEHLDFDPDKGDDWYEKPTNIEAIIAHVLGGE